MAFQDEGRNDPCYLERQFCELPQVVPVEAIMAGWVRMSTWSVFPVCCRRPVAWRAPEHSIKLTILRFLPVCLCCRPCSSDGMCAFGSQCIEKASGYLSKMKWTQMKTNLLHRCQGSSPTCRSGSRGSPCRPRSTWPYGFPKIPAYLFLAACLNCLW